MERSDRLRYDDENWHLDLLEIFGKVRLQKATSGRNGPSLPIMPVRHQFANRASEAALLGD